MHLDYAKPEKLRIGWTPAVLAVCTFLYWVVCIPALRQRGYPPINPVLQGLTFTWCIAIPLTALFERFSKTRALWLLAFGVVTGFIDCASWPVMVPNFFDPIGCAFMTILMYGPLHLLIILILEFASRGVLALASRVTVTNPARMLAKSLSAAFLLATAAAIPIAYAHIHRWELERTGRQIAEDSWHAGNASIRIRSMPSATFPGDIDVEVKYDPTTGLPLEHDFRHGWESANNSCLHELVAVNGRPAWAAPTIPSSADLAALLSSPDFTEVTTFPYDATPSITLIHGGTVTKFGGVMSSSGSALSVATARSGLCGIGSSRQPTFIRRDPAYPSLIFIRDGKTWLGVFTADGLCVAEVTQR
ncbi:MAG: hypothetical protein ACTHN5_14010 [Phycisphaerae bacterium]